MRYMNNMNPNITILIKRGPDLPKGENQNARQDKFLAFRFGLAETDDPEAIAVLDARSDCIREEDLGKVRGYVKETDVASAVEAEVKRRMAEIATPPSKQEGGPFECVVCKKRFPIGLALKGHMKTHRKELAHA